MTSRIYRSSARSYDPTRGPRQPVTFMASQLLPPMSAMCECGSRYGMHRVNDYACPNGVWRPGNGQAQWLTRNWKRA